MHGAQTHGGALADLLGPGARYRAVRLLGRGGMGEVYEAVHLALGSRVVVKLIRADRTNPQTVERMRLEAQALARLAHPNLVRVTDFDVTATGQPFFVMELLAGRSLGAELTTRKRMGVGEALDIATQALEGLAAAHEAGLVHRDIKPDNIFLCPSQQPGRLHVKVLDFGIAKIVAGAAADTPTPIAAPTAPGRLIGTPRYASPEQASARPLDARVDIYAMGVLLYEMLTGRSPFEEARSTVDILRAHLTQVPDPPSRYEASLIPALDAVVLRCLAKKPDDRYPTTRDLLAALYDVWRTAYAAASAAVAPSAAQPVAQPVPAVAQPIASTVAQPVAPTFAQPIAPSPPVVEPPPVPKPARREPARVPLAVVLVVLVLSGIVSSLATHFLYR